MYWGEFRWPSLLFRRCGCELHRPLTPIQATQATGRSLFNQLWQINAKGITTGNYDGGKGPLHVERERRTENAWGG